MTQKSQLTEKICTALRGCNGEISWGAIEIAAGRPLAEIRAAIRTARTCLERDEGIVFTTVMKIGLRRLSDSEKIASTAEHSRKIHRTAGAGIARLAAVSDMARLSNADQMTATLRQTVFTAVRRETSNDKQAEA
ncbi:hypothetical protein [Paracoccus litorisediminis]|uniref:Uncharacterized protein n=1 Tax=Paracoccus litorisediminis TaxID=2006130 RepID=A0A844HP37_9RHOB|nr:hypothetical protein [Paracoccus litorisediminis]MTH62133.1 hypothetical protein [Paracoccus litorisediminis]